MYVAALLLATGVALLLWHAASALAYYALMLRRSRAYRPPKGAFSGTVTVVIPTYNESKIIRGKLDNVASQWDPSRLEIIVVDSSTDGTADEVERWSRGRGLPVKVLREASRSGKHAAENWALREARGDVVVFTDADCEWSPGSLRSALSSLAAPGVGLVTCIKEPPRGVEGTYRSLYNVLRLGESQVHSTPIAHGELLAVRRDLATKLGGLRPGADDSDLAHRVAMEGLRSIALPDAVCREYVPGRGYFRWKLRRAQHLVEHMARASRDLPRAPKGYRAVLAWESFLHLVNPWLALASLASLAASAALGSLPAAVVLALIAASMTLGMARTWALEQLFLVTAMVKNLRGREYVWEKVEKPLSP